MEDFRLKTFFSVANNLSFTKASQELFISQPAITRQIAKLESEYGVKFFERLGRKLKLTAAGEIFFEKTSKILKDYEDLDYTMHLLTKDQVGKLRLGASTTIAQYVLPKVLASFKHFYPKVGITMLSGNSRTIEDALKSDLLDVGFVEGIHQTQGLQYTPFLEDELKVITNNSFKAQSLTLKDFIGSPLVLRERGSGTLEVIEEALLTKQVDFMPEDFTVDYETYPFEFRVANNSVENVINSGKTTDSGYIQINGKSVPSCAEEYGNDYYVVVRDNEYYAIEDNLIQKGNFMHGLWIRY